MTERHLHRPAPADAADGEDRSKVAFRLSGRASGGQSTGPVNWSVTAGALLLDLDGTLADTRDAVISTWRAVAEEINLPFGALQPYIHGIPAEQVLERVAPRMLAAERASLAERLRRQQASPDVPARPMPGARELLAQLAGVPWAIVTSADARLATATLSKTGLPEPPVLITTEDSHLGKPHPHPYLQAARAVRVPAGRCLAIEDSPAGIQAALGAGMRVVALTTTHSWDDVQAADYVAADLASVGFERI